MSAQEVKIILRGDAASLQRAGKDAEQALAKVGAGAQGLGGAFRSAGASAAAAGQATAAAAERSGGALNALLQRAHAYVGVTVLMAQAHKALQARDAFVGLQSRLDQLAGSAREGAAAMQQVLAVAQRQGASLDAVGESYVRVGNSVKLLGGGALETARIVETVGAALRLNNASTAEAAAVMRQFGQAMAKGRVNGDEFTSLMENAPTLMNAVSVALGKTQGELYKMAEAGQLTSAVFGTGVLASFASLTAAAAAMPRTVGQAATGVSNAFGKMAGESRVLAVAAQAVTGTLDALAANAQAVMGTLGVAVAAVATVLGGRMVSAGAAARASSLAVRAALATETAFWAAQTTAIGANAAATTAAAGAKALAARAGAGLLGILGGPVGLVATIVLGAAAWLSYKKASEPPAAGPARSHIELLRQQAEALERDTAARLANTASKKDATRADLLAAVNKARSERDAQPAYDLSGEIGGSSASPYARALRQAEADLAAFDAVNKRMATAGAASAQSLTLVEKPASLDSLVQGLATREKALTEYAQTVRQIAASTTAAMQELAGAGRGASPAAAAGVNAQRDMAMAAARKTLGSALTALSAEQREADTKALAARAAANAAANADLSLTGQLQANASAERLRSLAQEQAALDARRDLDLVSAADHADARLDILRREIDERARLIEQEIALEQRRPLTVGDKAAPFKQQQDIASLRGKLDAERARLPAARDASAAKLEQQDQEGLRARAKDWAQSWQEAEQAIGQLQASSAAARAQAIADPVARETALNRLQIQALLSARDQLVTALERSRDIATQDGQTGMADLAREQIERVSASTATAVVRANADLADRLKPGWQRQLDGWSDLQADMRARSDAFMDGFLAKGRDIFTEWATTGRLSARGLVQFIQAEFARMVYDRFLAGSVASLGQSLFGALFGAVAGGGGLAGAVAGAVGGAVDGKRAAGGPVQPWGTYLVGERGPELLRMGAAGGAVIPNRALQASSAAGPVVNITQNLTFNGGVSRVEVAAGMARARDEAVAAVAEHLQRGNRAFI